MARAYSFPPGLVIENPNFQAIILALIDKIAPSQKLKNAVKERNRKDIITFCNLRFVEH
ncbi:hypothetical protein IJM86_04220 [bacterium]|nr:hypothetical protein [bacterium]